MTNGTIFNPAALAGTVYGIAGAGISLGLLAGMARGVQEITYGRQPIAQPRRQSRYKPRRIAQPYKPYRYAYKPKYTWR